MRRVLYVLIGMALASTVTLLAQNWVVTNGTNSVTASSPNPTVTIRNMGTGKDLCALNSTNTQVWCMDTAGTQTLANGTTITDSASGKVLITGTTPMIQLGGTSSTSPALKRAGTSLQVRSADDSGYQALIAGDIQAASELVTAGSGTGITVNSVGVVTTHVYKVTASSTAFVTAGVTSDITIATLPAKTILLGVYAELATTFACASVCTTGTLSFTLGSSAGGNDVLVSFDADAATARFGLVDTDLGTAMTRATAVQGGKLFSWTTTTPMSLRLTSGTGNLGNGTVTNLSQGSITFYLLTAKLV